MTPMKRKSLRFERILIAGFSGQFKVKWIYVKDVPNNQVSLNFLNLTCLCMKNFSIVSERLI